MKYTFFEIENYKGIKKLRFELDTHPISAIYPLVGLNESGKTTLLEAINQFRGGNDSVDPNDILGFTRPDEYDLIPIGERSNFNGKVIIKAGVHLEDLEIEELKTTLRRTVDYRISNFPNNFIITDQYEYENSNFVKTSTTWFMGSASGMKGRERSDRRITLYPQVWSAVVRFIKQQMPVIWYFPNFLFDFPDRIYLAEENDEGNSAKFYRALVQDILNSVINDATVEEHLLSRAESGEATQQISLRQLLLEMGRKVTLDVFDAWNRIFKRQVNLNVTLHIDSDDAGKKYLYFQIEDTDGFYSIRERSLGFRWFFAFLITATCRVFREGSPSGLIFLIDEPASNLHASAQAQLLDSFDSLAEYCTIVYTTHSPHLINPLRLETTSVVRNQGMNILTDVEDFVSKRTDIVVQRYREFASKHPDQSLYFQPILDVLDYKPSQLELVPEVVMLEGKNDFYGLRYFNDVILDLKLDLHLMPGGGAGSLDTVIRLYLSWGRNFIVLLDSDDEGKTQKNRYIKLFGSIVESRILLLGDLDSSLTGKSLDHAIEIEDRKAIQESVFPGSEYRKNKFFRALQESLYSRQKIKLTDKTSKQFTTLLRAIQEKLDSVK